MGKLNSDIIEVSFEYSELEFVVSKILSSR